MILADTNFWLALALSKHEFHDAAQDWFEQQRPDHGVLFCRTTQQSFLRLLTTESILRLFGIPPLSNTQAWVVYEAISTDARCAFANEPAAIESRWKSFAKRSSASPKLWMDAYLAAFAVAGGHQLVTTDKAFSQFKNLDLILLSNQ